MPCIDAIDKKALTLKSQENVESALAKLKKAKTPVAVVIDEDGQAAGLFSIKGIMQNLMPVSLPVGDGPVSSITLDAAPGVARRLRKLYPLTVREVMDRKVQTIAPEARVVEAMRKMLEAGAPAVIILDDEENYLGLVTESSLMERLESVG